MESYCMINMNNIGGIIDMDGFTVNKTFYCKEIGINLETLGCPKADHLFKNLIWLETCGHHIGADPYKHCPKVEVEAFGAWLKEKAK